MFSTALARAAGAGALVTCFAAAAFAQGGPPAAAPAAPQATIEGQEQAPLPAPEQMSEWPCVQGKVENLSTAAIWDGPALPDLKGWFNDRQLVDLVKALTSRRVTLEQAQAAVKAYAAGLPEGERDQKLSLLFAALFEASNNERRGLINGIAKYQRAQKERASELERQSQALIELEQKAQTDEAAAKEYETDMANFQWASRIFQDRQTSIPLACELPVMLEERLFAITRTIRENMKS